MQDEEVTLEDLYELTLNSVIGTQVKFVYLAEDDTESDTEFVAHCNFVPRPGDYVIPQAGAKKVLVKRVYHAPLPSSGEERSAVMAVTVCLVPRENA